MSGGAAKQQPEKVCVTGGAGYVASWLIMRLLRRGYSVRATVRSDPRFKEDAEHLWSLPGAEQGRLEIFDDFDLCEPDSFGPAVEGCVGVFHLAHPTDFSLADPERTVIRAAVDGVLGLIRACAASTTVRRLVYTSSASAVVFAGRREGAGGAMDESMWSDVDYCRELDNPFSPYFVSKTLAEKAALEAGEKIGVQVVTVIPSFVIGPFLGPHLPPAIANTLALVREDKERAPKDMHFVHIDDIASAHIFLFECEEAKGRYICSSHDIDIHMLANCIKKYFPERNTPASLSHEVGGEKEVDHHLSSKKLLDLGFEFKYSLEDMFDGAFKCSREKGLLSHLAN